MLKNDENLYIIGEKYVKKKDLLVLEGFASDLLGMKIVKKSNVIEEYPCSSISSKIFKVPVMGDFITYPIIHTFQSFN